MSKKVSAYGVRTPKEPLAPIKLDRRDPEADDVEAIPIQRVNEAYARTLKSDVKYRIAIDLESLRSGVKG